MPFYRCFFFDEQDHIVFPAEIIANDAEAAKRQAFSILDEMDNTSSDSRDLNRPIVSLEIWQGSVKVFRF
jgi:hypothetical protein